LLFPTLKRGASKRRAYGAKHWSLLMHRSIRPTIDRNADYTEKVSDDIQFCNYNSSVAGAAFAETCKVAGPSV